MSRSAALSESSNPFLSSDSEEDYPVASVTTLLGLNKKLRGSKQNLLQENENFNPFTSSDSDSEAVPVERSYKRSFRERARRRGKADTTKLLTTLCLLSTTFLILLTFLIVYSRVEIDAVKRSNIGEPNSTDPSSIQSTEDNISLDSTPYYHLSGRVEEETPNPSTERDEETLNPSTERDEEEQNLLETTTGPAEPANQSVEESTSQSNMTDELMEKSQKIFNMRFF